jgi:hypothetical protein
MFQRDPCVANSTQAVTTFVSAVQNTPLWPHIVSVVGRHLREVGYSWTSTFGTYTTGLGGHTVFTSSHVPLLYLTLVELEWLVADVEAILHNQYFDSYSPWLFTGEEYERIFRDRRVNDYVEHLNKQQER